MQGLWPKSPDYRIHKRSSPGKGSKEDAMEFTVTSCTRRIHKNYIHFFPFCSHSFHKPAGIPRNKTDITNLVLSGIHSGTRMASRFRSTPMTSLAFLEAMIQWYPVRSKHRSHALSLSLPQTPWLFRKALLSAPDLPDKRKTVKYGRSVP